VTIVRLCAVMPSAAAGINQVESNGMQSRKQHVEPVAQQSQRAKSNQGGNTLAENSQALSRQLVAVKRSLAKQEEEAAALVQQLRSRDQKLAASEQKLQNLERLSKAQAAEIQTLKKEIASTVGSVHAKNSELIGNIQDANSRLCEQFESSPKVWPMDASWLENGSHNLHGFVQRSHFLVQEQDQIRGHLAWIEGQIHSMLTSPPTAPFDHTASLSTGQTLGRSKMRESELIATVKSMQKAMEKQHKEMQSMVASSKYMQVLSIMFNVGVTDLVGGLLSFKHCAIGAHSAQGNEEGIGSCQV
jgi:uncharacterized protein (DUF3084 family)